MTVSTERRSTRDEPPRRILVRGPASVLQTRVVPELPALAMVNPRLGFHCLASDSAISLEGVQAGETQLAVVGGDAILQNFRWRPLAAERSSLFVCTDWRGRELDDLVENEAIVDFDPMDDSTYRWFRRFGIRRRGPALRHFANNMSSLVAMVAVGLGYSVLDVDFARPWVEANRLHCVDSDRVVELGLSLVWSRQAEGDDLVEELARRIR